MSKGLGSYVGSEYLRTLGYSPEEIVGEINQELLKKVGVGELPKANYSCSLNEYLSGYSIGVIVSLEEELDSGKISDYKEIIGDTIGKYNYRKCGCLLDKCNQRFFEGNIEFF